MWNRAKMVLATMILITASLTAYLPIYLKTYALAPTPSERSIPHFPHLPPEYYEPAGGRDVSLAEAQASVTFKIQLPTYTGGRDSFVHFELDQRPDICAVSIVYSFEWLPSGLSLFDLDDHNAIALTEMSVSQTWGTLQNAEANMKAFLNQYQALYPSLTQAVSINGYFGTAGGNVAHCVQWATETTYYYLRANLNCPLSQLIEIAQSIPIK